MAETQVARRLLTETELELMNIIWDIGEGTVNDVIKHLPPGRRLAYTSVSTILRILEKKTVLHSRKSGKSHIYSPLLEKHEYECRSVDHLLTHVFDNTPSSMVRALVDSRGLQRSELEDIQRLISERLKT